MDAAPEDTPLVKAMDQAFRCFIAAPDARDDDALRRKFNHACLLAEPAERHEIITRFVAGFIAEKPLPLTEVRTHFQDVARQYDKDEQTVGRDIAGNICNTVLNYFGAGSRLGGAVSMIRQLVDAPAGQPAARH